MSKMARDCDFFRGAVILINRPGLFYENKHTYIGYTVGFSEEARWCCFPFTAFFSPPPSISLPLPSPPSTVNRHFILTVPLFLYCWEPSVIYLGGPSSVSVSFQKKKGRKEEGYVPSQLTPRIKSILTDYPRVSLSPKT